MNNLDDELVEAMLDAWYPGENWRSLELPSARTDMLAVLAVARPAIRNAALDEAAAVLDTLWDDPEHFRIGGLASMRDAILALKEPAHDRD